MLVDWLIRLIKGALIGTGFILPGVSGGALAAVFGLYERIIEFIAHITRNFIKNVLFFIPVGAGALLGMFLLSHPLAFFLEHYEAQVLWGFIGCIIGTLPKLWKDAGKTGREKKHIVIMLVSLVAGFAFLLCAEIFLGANIPQNPGTWGIAGVLIGLGVLVPGMSPSNFLVYLGMYKPMVDAFKAFDFSVLLFIAIGGALCVFSLSKLVYALFSKAYTGFFHVILGIVLASTLMIIPGTPWSEVVYNYLTAGTFVCVLTLAAGALLGWGMCLLEEKYKK
jgi:putative membrane protein